MRPSTRRKCAPTATRAYGSRSKTVFAQAIETGRHGFATLAGEGRREGVESTFSQRNTVAREHVESLPQSWSEMYTLLGAFLQPRRTTCW